MFTGHPKGLFRLFFIEMWERLAFYTMVGILFLYATDRETGGLGLPRAVGSEIYGLYLAFVYFTPYLGGLIADRFLGYRKSVLIGGLFFAAGFALMAMGLNSTFVAGLVCLCVGNGFFKPNISAMVGNLYQAGDPKRDAGFNIFYMGINIGAFVANFLAAMMRNWYGWLAIFVAAGLGMLIGIAILLSSWKTLEAADRQPGPQPGDTPFGDIVAKILLPALVVGVAGYYFAIYALPESVTRLVRPSDIGFLLGSVPIIAFFVNLARRAEPEERPGLAALLPIYVAGGTFFMVLHLNGSAMTAWANENTNREAPAFASVAPFSLFAGEAYPGYYLNAGGEVPRPGQATVVPIEDAQAVAMLGQRRISETALASLAASLPDGVTIERESTVAAEDWARWAGRAVDVYAEVTVEQSVGAHGEPVLTAKSPDDAKRLDRIVLARTVGDERIATVQVAPEVFAGLYAADPPQLEPGKLLRTWNAELYQSLNALFVILFTPLLVWFFAHVRAAGYDFSTARKVVAGMVITALAVLFMALAGFVGDDGASKVSWWWLFGFYAIVTVGELCLSPMALSLVTKLSPKRFVGLTMGGWFFATAVGNKFSGFLGGIQRSLPPSTFFLVIAGAVAVVALGLFVLLPRLDAAIKKYGA